MKLTDVVALAKAGYRKADIDELLAVQVDEPDPIPAEPESTEPEAGSGGDPVQSPEISADDPDYEQLYKDVLGQIETLKSDLKAAQAKNIKQSIPDQESDPLDDLADVFRSYM